MVAKAAGAIIMTALRVGITMFIAGESIAEAAASASVAPFVIIVYRWNNFSNVLTRQGECSHHKRASPPIYARAADAPPLPVPPTPACSRMPLRCSR